MTLFLSTYVNRVDKKGRVSVPATFRAALSAQAFQGIVLFRSNVHACLEGFGWDYMNELSMRLDHFNLFSEEQDDLATAIFGESVQLPFDGDGRVVLPVELMRHAGVVENAAFVGMGRKFQLWDPDSFARRKEEARRSVRDRSLTVPKGDAA